MQECAGGVEKMVVLTNDGAGEQDISLLIEVADVIELSLPLIGRVVSPGINDCPHLSTQAKPPALAGLAQILLMARNMCTPQNAAKLVFAPDHQSLVLLRQTNTARRVLGALVLKPHCPRGFLEVVFCVVRKEEQRRGVGTRLVAMLKHHALSLGCLHLLTYADDSATGFFERLGFEIDHDAAMPMNRFHWGISHYIGSQLRQCVLDPDGEARLNHFRRHFKGLGAEAECRVACGLLGGLFLRFPQGFGGGRLVGPGQCFSHGLFFSI